MTGHLNGYQPLSRKRIQQALTPNEWLRLGLMFAVITLLHIAGWATLTLVVAPAHYNVGNNTFGIGIGLTAYTLGLRHAFDADHIAAIDNTTRKLMNDGQRPQAVGFFFSLGHSSVVFGLALLLTLGLKTVIGPVQESSSALHHYVSLIGTTISGVFLYVIAIVNIIILASIANALNRARLGYCAPEEIANQLNSSGLLNRFFSRFTKTVKSSWHMYPIGMLFGLGFDTATEIALLVLAGTGTTAGLPWYAILCLPVLFAAGMCLLDTIDGSFMNFAYGWTLSNPVRKIYYNITMTGLSVIVALLIGSIEFMGLLATQFGWRGGFWDWLDGIDLNAIGFLVVSLFVMTWISAVLIWRYTPIRQAELPPATANADH
ncbi:MAG: HoxN/HupN/NixA family nickel/cobalt transporter [Mycobacteriaceae bacterium]|nr:HoxN/HupN/NixA family nickel/cobalt transporter [Mycobacteriaceae bacterium]